MMKNTIENPLLLAEEIADCKDAVDRLNAKVTATCATYTTASDALAAARAERDEFIKRTKHDWPTDREFALAREVVRLSGELALDGNAKALDKRALLLCEDLETGKPCGRDALLRLLNALRSRGWG